jgi:hypothetical protein
MGGVGRRGARMPDNSTLAGAGDSAASEAADAPIFPVAAHELTHRFEPATGVLWLRARLKLDPRSVRPLQRLVGFVLMYLYSSDQSGLSTCRAGRLRVRGLSLCASHSMGPVQAKSDVVTPGASQNEVELEASVHFSGDHRGTFGLVAPTSMRHAL